MYALGPQEGPHRPLGEQHADVALEDHAVEHGQAAGDVLSMKILERAHRTPPSRRDPRSLVNARERVPAGRPPARPAPTKAQRAGIGRPGPDESTARRRLRPPHVARTHTTRRRLVAAGGCAKGTSPLIPACPSLQPHGVGSSSRRCGRLRCRGPAQALGRGGRQNTEWYVSHSSGECVPAERPRREVQEPRGCLAAGTLGDMLPAVSLGRSSCRAGCLLFWRRTRRLRGCVLPVPGSTHFLTIPPTC